jgi:hypothetical protein
MMISKKINSPYDPRGRGLRKKRVYSSFFTKEQERREFHKSRWCHLPISILSIVIRVRMVLVLNHGCASSTSRDNTDATHMLLRLVVVDKQLSVLAVAAGFFTSSLDDGEDRVGLAENGVHLLQGAVGGFGVEEVDDGDDESVAVLR